MDWCKGGIMATVTFRGITYTPTIASSNNQTLIGTQKPDWLQALGGNNRIFARSGNDVVLAGVEVTSITGFPPFGGEAIFYNPLVDQAGNNIAGNNIIDAGSGNDYVATGLGNDVVYLGDGNDIFDGAGGNNAIFGGAGNDLISMITIEGNRQLVDAGSGNDTVFLFSQEGGRHFINGGSGNDDIAANGNSKIVAGAGDDLIGVTLGAVVNSQGSIVDAGAGKDTIYAFTGDNLLYGGLDNDTIVSGRGNDTIFAGAGNDVINLRGGNATLRGQLATFFDVLFGGAPPVVGGGKDKVYLGGGKDIVLLGSGANFKPATIYGFGANDRLDVGGLDIAVSRRGANTILSAGGDPVAVLKGYTGSVNWV
jgi:Ca2+-binding RTX toxin-like protein